MRRFVKQIIIGAGENFCVGDRIGKADRSPQMESFKEVHKKTANFGQFGLPKLFLRLIYRPVFDQSTWLAEAEILVNSILRLVSLRKFTMKISSIRRDWIVAFATLFAIAIFNVSVNADQLFSNGSIVTHPGGMDNGADRNAVSPTTPASTSLGTNANGAASTRLAEDFVIPTDFNLDGFTFFGYQTGSTTTSTMTGATVRVFQGGAPDVGTLVGGDVTTNVMTSTSFTNVFRTGSTDTAGTTRPIMRIDVTGLNLNLIGGTTYWVDWSLTGTSASGPFVPALSSPTGWVTGNGLQSVDSGVTYNQVTDGGSGLPIGYPFLVQGTAVPEPSVLALLALGSLVGLARRRVC